MPCSRLKSSTRSKQATTFTAGAVSVPNIKLRPTSMQLFSCLAGTVQVGFGTRISRLTLSFRATAFSIAPLVTDFTLRTTSELHIGSTAAVTMATTSTATATMVSGAMATAAVARFTDPQCTQAADFMVVVDFMAVGVDTGKHCGVSAR